MADKLNKNWMKRTAIVVVPLLVLIFTVVVVGMTYAWFSTSSVNNIATIDFSTLPRYEIEFILDQEGLESFKYNGQTGVLAARPNASGAFNAEAASTYGKHLVTSNWAGVLSADGDCPAFNSTKYLLDSPFVFYADMTLVTGDDPIDLHVSITNVLIEFRTAGGEPDPAYSALTRELPNDDDGTVDDIACGFTWYIKQMGGDDTGRVYSPYGVASGSGGNITYTNYRAGETSTWSALPELHDITDFSASGETFRFYIVFAPEKLFWYQYSEYSINNGEEAWKWNMDEVYNSTELNKYGWNYLNYTSQNYAGATFKFTVTLESTGS